MLKTRFITSFIVCIGFLLFSSCGPKLTQSGFLSSYNNLEESEANATMLSYINPNIEKGKYKKLMVDEITTKFGKKAKGLKINQEKLDELTAYFKAEIINALSTDYTLVDQVGDDVAQIQIAITEIIPTRLTSNIFPIGVAVNTATGRGKGGASLEMKVVDSQTKALLGQAIDNRKNRSYIRSFSKFGNARGALTYWSKLLKERIDLFKAAQ
ncbi:hypothetical protein A9Q87_02630 [Flavobacteriales bacterium 34_180_T64]|nr:hypothetical protein A9Q87_02630 [Flavobacteriales bacterium 34_180_T64]